MAIKRSIYVGRYFGIDVYLHYSWFFIFILLAWALATGFFPQKFPGQSPMEYWGLGLFSSALLFVSVLAHELSHSVVARKRGMKVDRITLFFFGGMAGLHETKFTPKTEFQMAIAGPMMSLLISLLFLIIYNLTTFFYVAAVASYLYRINLILAIFNLVPGFPLDGGRVLRSIIWYWTKDFKRATRIATSGGKFVAYFLIFVGFANVFLGNFAGLWFVLIGFFLLLLSTLSYEQVVIKDALTGKKAGEFVVRRFPSLDPGMNLREAVVKYFFVKAQEEYPVIKDKRFQGVIAFRDIQALKKKEWRGKRVRDVMIPESKVGKVKLMTGAYTALVKMLKSGLGFIPVMSKSRLVGIVRRDDMLRYVKLKAAKEKFEKMGFKVK